MRLVRAAVLTALVVVLTVVAHRLGGGMGPGLLGLVVLAALLWPLALLATRRRLGALPLVAGLGAGQLLGHGLLSWLAGSAASTSGTSGALSLDCLQHAAHQRSGGGCLGEATASVVGHDHAAVDTGLLMLATHVLATVLAALLVARGEQVLWRLLELVLRALPVLLRPVPAPTAWPTAPLLVPARADVDVPVGRGPPAYAA